MSREEERQLEKMIEVIVRAIPKEESAAKLYRDTAQQAKREISRMLFDKLATDGEERVNKLKATLSILSKELERLRSSDVEAAAPESCTPAQEFNANIRSMLRMARDLNNLAEKGLRDADDPSCRQMYQTVQEMSVKLRGLADSEMESHIIKDKWD